LSRTLGDFRPEALAAYHEYLRKTYERPSWLRAAHARQGGDDADGAPPRSLFGMGERSMQSHLDWFEFQRGQQLTLLQHWKDSLYQQGFDTVPFSLPHGYGGERGAPNLTRAAPPHRTEDVGYRLIEAEARARAEALPSFTRLSSGVAFAEQPTAESELRFRALLALAHGVRGFCVDPAVERSRFVGALLDKQGTPTSSAEYWAQLLEALERCQYNALIPEAPVYVLVPERLRMLAAASQAFKPAQLEWFLPPSPFQLASLTEQGELETAPLQDAERFIHTLCDCLNQARIPFVMGTDEQLEAALANARWTIVVTLPELDAPLIEGLRFALRRGAALSIGPTAPRHIDVSEHARAPWPVLLPTENAALSAHIHALANTEDLQQYGAEPRNILVRFHRANSPGELRCLGFVINYSEHELQAQVACPGYDAVDALSREPIHSFAERLELAVPARSVRMLELRAIS
jgi:hypothetical protein